MSVKDLYIEYHDTMNKAKELEDLADRLMRLSKNQVDESINVMQSGWKGSASDEACKKTRKSKEQLQWHATQLKLVAAALKRSAKRYYDIEIAMASILDR